MPELPEVETTRRGIEPLLKGQTISQVIVRQPQLRWPIPEHLATLATGQCVQQVQRRGKYLLIRLQQGCIIIHLGMSGSLRVLSQAIAPLAHDHVDIVFADQCLRLRDPRRFGAVLWADDDGLSHDLLNSLGPEPLTSDFDVDVLFKASRGRQVAVKNFIMNAHIVVGVGNIYASEALFLAGIRPTVKAGKISRKRYEKLVEAIKFVLQKAIDQGGTTLRDFANADGLPGYFKQKLNVYDRAGEACYECAAPIQQKVIGQRSSYYCPHCQKY